VHNQKKQDGLVRRRGGFSLIETLFYVSLLSLALLIVSETVLVMVRSAETLRASAHLAQDAGASFARLTREIRGATGITDVGSVWNTSPGALTLQTTDAVGAAKTVEFRVLNGALYLFENNLSLGALTGSSTVLTNLVFRKIPTTESTGVKIEMTLRSTVGTASSTKSFYATVVLRSH